MLTTPVAAAGQVTITSMSLVKPDYSNAVLNITLQNLGMIPVTSITVTLDGEAPADVVIAADGLAPGASLSDTLPGLTGSYLVGNTYLVSVNATYADHSTSSLDQSVVCEAGPTRAVGVGPGEQFRYAVALSWNSTTPPSSDSIYTTFAGMQWANVQVTGVSGTNVSGQMTMHYQNGNETTSSGWVDVESGDSNGGMSSIIVAANLGVGDETYLLENVMIINSTADRTYPGGARATNYAEYAAVGPSFVENFYWDKATGAAVERDINSTSQQGADTVLTSLQLTLVDSGAWVVPEFSPMMLLALFTAFTLVAVTYCHCESIRSYCKNAPVKKRRPNPSEIS